MNKSTAERYQLGKYVLILGQKRNHNTAKTPFQSGLINVIKIENVENKILEVRGQYTKYTPKV